MLQARMLFVSASITSLSLPQGKDFCLPVPCLISLTTSYYKISPPLVNLGPCLRSGTGTNGSSVFLCLGRITTIANLQNVAGTF